MCCKCIYLFNAHGGGAPAAAVKAFSESLQHACLCPVEEIEPAPLECSELPFPVGHVRISLLANAIICYWVIRFFFSSNQGAVICCYVMVVFIREMVAGAVCLSRVIT